MTTAAIALVFLMLFAVVVAAAFVGFVFVEKSRKHAVVGMVGVVAPELAAQRSSILDESKKEEETSILEYIAALPVARTLQNHIDQAALPWSAPSLIVAMMVSAGAGALLGGLFVRTPTLREAAIFGVAALAGLIPYLYVLRRRNKRLGEFETQFPEALDFLARSLRAGHAFSVSLEMMADESPEPLGVEFKRLFNEQNLGLPLETALKNLAIRVPLIDVRFFVSAVLLQRETGGNLAEILTNLSHVIRERFRLKGHIRATSAHGRLTAAVLTVMPIVTALGLTLLSPGYYDRMTSDDDGRLMIVGAFVAQTIGFMLMRKIVNIKV